MGPSFEPSYRIGLQPRSTKGDNATAGDVVRIQQATECHCSLMEQVDASRKEEASHGMM